ncbi:MAG TPA: hypothetical protein VKD04_15035 [Burkholderiales bacterium]|nr:hypothetical protein [Burkholderiales bacterium]
MNTDLRRDVQPQSLGLMQLREDPQYRRIPVERRLALVEAALKDGRSLADRTRNLWGHDPATIATRCNVPVIRSGDDAGFGSVIVHAEYVTRPPSITLYVPAIRRLDKLVGENGIAACRCVGGTLPIFLAHELYHHFDCQRGHTRLSRRHAVNLFGLGPWHWTSGLSSLSEIAAGAFAQQLLGLPFHPKLLDLLLVGKDKA